MEERFRCACLLVGFIICYVSAAQDSTGDTFEVRNTRHYYLTAEKVEWDYLPAGKNIFTDDDEVIKETLINGPDRIGSKYSKYVFKQYTNASFVEEVPTPAWQGYVGPLLKSEVGEVIRVHFRNQVDIPVSVHPHGLRYTKHNEGALYVDHTNSSYKTDDAVLPGTETEYKWEITAEFSPTADDDACVPWAYHSHVNPDKEVNSGLLGLLLVCKPGTLDAGGTRKDADKEIVLFTDTVLEKESWLIDENLKRCQDPARCKQLFDDTDGDFFESLKKYSINGYLFGNLPGLTVCEGERVVWYMFALNAGLHPISVHGQSLIYRHHRTSVVDIWPATFATATMIPTNVGTWPLTCLNLLHRREGMSGLLQVQNCTASPSTNHLGGMTRHYFITAEADTWDYAPSGQNLYDGGSLTANGSTSTIYFNRSTDRIGGQYIKSRFFRYTDMDFRSKVTIQEEEKHLGMLGPIIRAEVGDNILILLMNKTPHPVSIHLQGTSVDKTNDGTWLKQNTLSSSMGGHVIPAGDLGTYTFTVPRSRAPGPKDPPCVPYLYYSAYNIGQSVNSGLVGPLLICKPGALDPATGRQRYVDRDMFLFYSSIDENLSFHLDTNIATLPSPTSVNKKDPDFKESNIMRSINGRSYGNLEGLKVCKGDKVVWHVMSFGETEGLHSVTFNGNNVMVSGINRDSHVVISGMAFNAIMHPDNIGTWSIHCHNNYHFEAGMKATYTVEDCGKPDVYVPGSGVTRRYYIAALERQWNYSPKTIHPLTSENYSNPNSDQYFRVQTDGKYIGSVYTKALYREFTDATFSTEKAMGEDEVHRGVVGPFIRAEVGDTIEVVFKNMAFREFSIHAQGLKYSKSSEGMKYKSGGADTVGDAVPPGTTFTYRWEVPESSGPGPNGPNCVGSLYHSATNPVKDTYSGLVGTVVICKPGTLTLGGARQDSVDKEFVILFQAFDENESWYIDQNIRDFAPIADTTTADFEESNKYDSINGLIYDNVMGLVAHVGDNIAWYVLGLGVSEDIHTAHFHGNTYLLRTEQTNIGDVIEVFPGTYETVEMFAVNKGTWLIHCHVSEHTRDGMVATYTIV